MIGTTLAHYEITHHLGSGGMGDVYQATDSKLGRSVAIKLLPETFTHDTERVGRLQREARVLASLNHPNIAAIHGIEEVSGRHFQVLDGRLMAAAIQASPQGIRAEPPRGLSSVDFSRGALHEFDVAPDGQRFLLILNSLNDRSNERLTVVSDWRATLRK